MSERNRLNRGYVRIVGVSSIGWALVAVCFAVDASPAWGQCPEEQKLTASDADSQDRFGYSVSVSGDTALIGAELHNLGIGIPGAAYVYVRSAGAWTEQQELMVPGWGPIGGSVSVSGDTAVVGDRYDDAAHVFVRSGGTWTHQQTLIASDAASFTMGDSVSLSGDTVLVGAFQDDHAGNNSGSAYIFVRSDGVWTQQQKLIAMDAAADDWFGYRVSLSGDTAVVGAYHDDDAGASSGSAYLFVRSGPGAPGWTQQQKLTAFDAAAGDAFGVAVAISGDTAVVGAYADDDLGQLSGAAYVYVGSGGVWTQQQKLTASDGVGGDFFGISVGVDNDTAVIGAHGNDADMNSPPGSAYVFVRSGAVWIEHEKLNASDGELDEQFGISVSVSGNTVVVGNDLDDHAGSRSGSA